MTITLETTAPTVGKAEAITGDSLRKDVNQFLLENCSQIQREEWINQYSDEASKEILALIKDRDVQLTRKLKRFTPHESCQVSFVRDVLLQRCMEATA